MDQWMSMFGYKFGHHQEGSSNTLPPLPYGQTMQKQDLFIEQDSPSPDCLLSSPSPSPSPCRSSKPDNTLRALTCRFQAMICSAPDQTIEIQDASRRLSIQKRRIYDITNVLQGVGYVQKLGKNLMKWVGGDEGHHLEQQARELDLRTSDVDRRLQQLDEDLAAMNELIERQIATHPTVSFLSSDDLARLMCAHDLEQFMVYAGGVGDRMSLEGAQEGSRIRCVIEGAHRKGRLFNCSLGGVKKEVRKEESGSGEGEEGSQSEQEQQWGEQKLDELEGLQLFEESEGEGEQSAL